MRSRVVCFLRVAEARGHVDGGSARLVERGHRPGDRLLAGVHRGELAGDEAVEGVLDLCRQGARHLGRFLPDSGAERNLVRIAIHRAALGQLVLAETALVGAGAALQILEAEVAEQGAARVDRTDARSGDVEQAAGDAGDGGREGVERGGDPPYTPEGV